MIFPRKYMNIIGNRILEEATVLELLEFQKSILDESNLLKTAKNSVIYKKKWRKNKIKAKDINYENLKNLPFITNKEIGEYSRYFNKTVMEVPRNWFYNMGDSKIKWIPYSSFDIYILLNLIDRAIRVVDFKHDDIILNVDYAAPSFGDMFPFLIAYSQILRKPNGLKTEILSISLDLLNLGVNRLDFALKRKPTTLLMRPRTALQIPDFLPYPLENLKKGVFFGESIINYRDKILKKYPGIEIYEMYSKIENIGFNVECGAHKGVHIWLDNCIPEIIPSVELEIEKEDGNFTPSATHLCKAKHGEIGELVITMFREAFPLIRYRTGDMIKIESIKTCECGRSHPRVSFQRKQSIESKEYEEIELKPTYITQ